jgi:hypothetical protein
MREELIDVAFRAIIVVGCPGTIRELILWNGYALSRVWGCVDSRSQEKGS